MANEIPALESKAIASNSPQDAQIARLYSLAEQISKKNK